MKIVILAGSLTAGGAERQACTIAAEMKRQGLDVRLVTYAPGAFYLPILQEAGIEHCHLPTAGKLRHLRRVLAVRRELRRGSQDVVLAFDFNPNVYSELASWPRRRWGLVVSERAGVAGIHRRGFYARSRLHLQADYVVTNSHANRLLLERAVPKLAERIVTIYNAVELEKFRPQSGEIPTSDGFRFVVASRYIAIKNVTGLAEGLALWRRRSPHVEVTVDWYGDVPSQRVDHVHYEEAKRRIAELGLQDHFRLHGKTPHIVGAYCLAHAVLLPSFSEGLPNAICEGMACGRPILMSAVCDAGNLVKSGVNGFLFDPASPRSIAESIGRFAALKPEQRAAMGRHSRQMAEALFDQRRITAKYIDVLESAAQRKRARFTHWPPQVPETAYAGLRHTGPTELAGREDRQRPRPHKPKA